MGTGYVGSVPLVVGIFLLIKLLLERRKSGYVFHWPVIVEKFLVSKPEVELGIAFFGLFVVSWGYIIHVAGVRFNWIPTPSLVMALVWPRLVYVRALDRFVVPFTLFLVGLVVYQFNRCYEKTSEKKRVVVAMLAFLLAGGHIYEIKGYLGPNRTTVTNPITQALSCRDQFVVRFLAQGRQALLLVPMFRDSVSWNLIGYSLAYHSQLPINGNTVALGIPSEVAQTFQNDIVAIEGGKISQIVEQYGQVMIASPSDIAAKIIDNSDVKLNSVALESQDVVILLPQE